MTTAKRFEHTWMAKHRSGLTPVQVRGSQAALRKYVYLLNGGVGRDGWRPDNGGGKKYTASCIMMYWDCCEEMLQSEREGRLMEFIQEWEQRVPALVDPRDRGLLADGIREEEAPQGG